MTHRGGYKTSVKSKIRLMYVPKARERECRRKKRNRTCNRTFKWQKPSTHPEAHEITATVIILYLFEATSDVTTSFGCTRNRMPHCKSHVFERFVFSVDAKKNKSNLSLKISWNFDTISPSIMANVSFHFETFM